MSLLNEWQELLNSQTKSTVNDFWEEYSETESKIYAHILSHKDEHLSGSISGLVDFFKCSSVIFVGFLEGINTSLYEPLELNKITMESNIDLSVNFEELYKNMHKADADYLWSLEEWNDVFTEEKRRELYDEYRRSRTVRVEKKPGRNNPCPCGSGKKYKNCCGKKA